MSWLANLLISFFKRDASVVGRSRLDEEADRFWQWIVFCAVFGIGVALFCLRNQ
jgi:hypothetical protein